MKLFLNSVVSICWSKYFLAAVYRGSTIRRDLLTYKKNKIHQIRIVDLR